MADINVIHVDQTYVCISADDSILREIYDHFSYFSLGYKYSPKFQAGYWDGKIHLLNMRTQYIYKGILPDVITFCETNNYTFSIDPLIYDSIPDMDIDLGGVKKFFTKIKAPYIPHLSQQRAVSHCLNNGRAVILASTNAGKSYMMYGLAAYHFIKKQKSLVIVDRSQLVMQIKESFNVEYGGLFKTATIYDSQEEIDQADVLVSTWQSIYNNDPQWFKRFDVIMGDEIHKFKAASIKQIIDMCGHISFRYGFTATLDNDSKCDRLIVIGMFGTPLRVSTPQEDIANGISSKPTIYAIILKYNDEDRKKLHSSTKKLDVEKRFPVESAFVEEHEARTKFIIDLNSQLKGNTLIAFKKHSHGKKLFEKIKQLKDNVFFANYTVKLAKRIEISKKIDELDDATGVVSFGTFSTGISIRNINNMIIGSQVKSKITVPQLVGRGMRLKTKRENIEKRSDTLNFFDIGDDISYNGKTNIFFNHFKLRLEMYKKDGYKIIIKEINL